MTTFQLLPSETKLSTLFKAEKDELSSALKEQRNKVTSVGEENFSFDMGGYPPRN